MNKMPYECTACHATFNTLDERIKHEADHIVSDPNNEGFIAGGVQVAPLHALFNVMKHDIGPKCYYCKKPMDNETGTTLLDGKQKPIHFDCYNKLCEGHVNGKTITT